MNAAQNKNTDARFLTYIAGNRDGTYDAFVQGRGFRANVSMPKATEFIRQATGRSNGSVPFWDREQSEWCSEIDIAADQ